MPKKRSIRQTLTALGIEYEGKNGTPKLKDPEAVRWDAEIQNLSDNLWQAYDRLEDDEIDTRLRAIVDGTFREVARHTTVTDTAM